MEKLSSRRGSLYTVIFWIKTCSLIFKSFDRKYMVSGSFQNGMQKYYSAPSAEIIYSGEATNIANETLNISIFAYTKKTIVISFFHGLLTRYFKYPRFDLSKKYNTTKTVFKQID